MRRSSLTLAAFWTLLLSPAALADNAVSTIERVKGSVVAIGTFERTRSPPFQFRATGFAVGDGSLIATNAHVLPAVLDSERRETLVVLVPAQGREPRTTGGIPHLGGAICAGRDHPLAVRAEGCAPHCISMAA